MPRSRRSCRVQLAALPCYRGWYHNGSPAFCYDLLMPTLDDEILKAAQGLPNIAVLVVFGSRVQGAHRPDSDLDVAVLPDTAESRARRYLQADLAVALAHLAPEGRVDVILLDEAPEVLRQRIMETGRILLNRDPEAWKELRV